MLAEAVAAEVEQPAVVLALPRGGVPVAVPVARRLGAPLGLAMVRKLGVPGRPEVAMGALARVGGRTELVRHDEVIESYAITAAAFERVRQREEALLAERAERYGERALEVAGTALVLVDDGLATGMTALAAVTAARGLEPGQVVMAAPVGSAQAVRLVAKRADRVICPLVPPDFYAVSLWYARFGQVSDAEVLDALREFGC